MMPRVVKTVRQAIALLRRDPVLPMARLVEAVAGEPVKGSWWGHPEGNRIYNLSQAIEDSGEALAIKAPKVTYLHRALWAAWLRAISDASWRASKITKLDAAAKRLLARIDRDGEVREPDRKPREAIEKAHLAHAFSEHTDGGKHVTVMRTWARWASATGPELAAEAAALSLEDARAQLLAKGLSI
jgi:hypothetical protein